MLTGSNFRAWRDSVETYITFNDKIGFCFQEEKPKTPAEDDKASVKTNHKKWMHSNMMAKNVIRQSMFKNIRGCVAEPELASNFLEAVSAKFKESEKAEIARLNKEYHSMQYSGTGGVREHLLKLIHINNRLTEMMVEVQESLLVHHALNTLPSSFDHLRTSYNAQKENWTLDELIAICSDEEERIKKQTPTIYLLEKPKKKKTQSQNKLKPTKTITKSLAATGPKDKAFRFKCYFCKRVGHMKKDCTGYKAWLAKKGVQKDQESRK